MEEGPDIRIRKSAHEMGGGPNSDSHVVLISSAEVPFFVSVQSHC